MADALLREEFLAILSDVEKVTTTAQTFIDKPEETPPATKRRQVTQKLNACLQWLNAHRPKTNEDVLDYETNKVGQKMVLMRGQLAELAAFDYETPSQQPNRVTQHSILPQQMPQHVPTLPKSLEITVPIFNGDIDKYPAFIQAFEIATDHPLMSTKHKFMFFRDHLGPAVQPQIANLTIEEKNYDMALKVINDRYNNKQKIINALYIQLNNVKPATDNVISLRQMYDKVENLLQALEMHGEDVNNSVHVKGVVNKKIPHNVLFWLSLDHTPDLKETRKNLEKMIMMREELTSGEDLSPEPQNLPAISTTAVVTNKTEEKRTGEKRMERPRQIRCVFCRKDHYSDKCSEYPTLKDRMGRIGSRCTVCLRDDHNTTECTSTYSRGCFYCKKKKEHHSALCPEEFDKQTDAAKPQKQQKTPTLISLLKSEAETYLIATSHIQNPSTNEKMEIRVILDSASGKTYITQRVVQALHLRTYDPQETRIQRFADDEIGTLRTEKVNIRIGGLDKILIAETTDTICNNIPSFDYIAFKKRNPEYSHVNFADPGEGPIDLLIGSDYFFHFLTLERTLEIQPDLFMVNTILGTMINGIIKKQNNPVTIMLNTTDDIQKYWDLETLGIRENEIKDRTKDDQAYEQFNANIRREEERYTVGLPWKQYPPVLETNYKMAQTRLEALMRKYAANPNIIRECEVTFQKQLEEEIIEEVQGEIKGHYLPFHLVFTPGKSTQTRVVYDASARSGKGENSLNDCLLKGTNLTPQLAEILIRFRLNTTAITSDIKHAFHNVGVQAYDRDYLRFIWYENPFDDPEKRKQITLRFTRVPFGCISSSYLLAATVRTHLKESEHPLAEIIQRDLYIDDLVTGTETEQEASKMAYETMEIFRTAGMKIHKWKSNKPINIPEELQEQRNEVKILGIHWNANEDTLKLATPEPIDITKPITKRKILRSMAQLFDPLGWVSPIAITAKVFIQTLHKRKLDWNRTVETEERKKWLRILENLQQIDEIRFKRHLADFNTQTLSIHVFCDASAAAYAAAVYFRYQTSNGQYKVSLVAAKARVAPITEATIPRLELLAVLIGTRLLRYVRNAINTKLIQSALWTDSTCVLDWIQSPHPLPTFVHKRVTEIRGAENTEFRHVKGAENPADLPSRGTTTQEIKLCTRWWHGPRWLAEKEENWPPTYVSHAPETYKQVISTTAIAVKKNTVHSPFEIDETKFNRFAKLIRVTAFAIKFLQATKRNNINTKAPIEVAQTMWIRYIQERFFETELFILRKKRKPEGLVQHLQLFLDQEGIIRTRGRISGNQNIPYNTKFSILLPKATESYLSKLIILNTHENNMHVGTAHTLAAVRRKYWIPAGRQQVYYTLKACIACKRENARPFKQPEYSELPDARFKIDDFPFSNVGMDIAGPLYVIDLKRWILISTCLTTRAISLETLEDLTTQTIMLALKRITARYTQPKFILSDNAPQFVLLKQHLAATQTDPFTWKNIREHAPWEGACYERLIGLVKSVIHRTLKAQACSSDTELRTLVAEAEATLNQRPLTYVNESINLKPLTPNDFLKVKISAENIQPTETNPPTTETARYLRNLWINHTCEIQQFKRAWKEEYLNFLKERRATSNFKQRTTMARPKVEDIVLVQDSVQKRYNWPLAVIHQLQASHDGQIRACVLRLPSGTKVIRPIQQIYYMELSECEPPQPPVNAQRENETVMSSESETDEGESE